MVRCFSSKFIHGLKFMPMHAEQIANGEADDACFWVTQQSCQVQQTKEMIDVWSFSVNNLMHLNDLHILRNCSSSQRGDQVSAPN